MKFEKLVPDRSQSEWEANVWRHAGHGHVVPESLSRRQFLLGGTALASALGAGLLRPETAEAHGSRIDNVLPIPGTLEFFGEEFHVLGPPLTAPDDDPSTVFNFAGATGIAFISGMCTRRNRKTGETRELPFSFNDMRFMQGIYRGEDGRARAGTFAFV